MNQFPDEGRARSRVYTSCRLFDVYPIVCAIILGG